jgi:hypothetical protein
MESKGQITKPYAADKRGIVARAQLPANRWVPPRSRPPVEQS